MITRQVVLPSCIALVLMGLGAGCGKAEPCDQEICVRITNQHQEGGSPAEIAFPDQSSKEGGELGVRSQDGRPISSLSFGAVTDWFFWADGASSASSPGFVVFEARTSAAESWSAPQRYSFSGLPSSMLKGQRYELVVR